MRKIIIFLVLFLIFFGLLAGTASADVSETWNIYDSQYINDTSLICNDANIIINPGGSLTIDNSTLTFNNSVNCRNGITVKVGNTTIPVGGELILKNNSVITGSALSHTYIFSDYCYMNTPKTPKIQANDSYFYYMGNASIGTKGIQIDSSCEETWFDNCTIEHCFNGIYFLDHGNSSLIKDCYINDIDSAAIFKMKFYGPYVINTTVNNSRFCFYGQYTDGLSLVSNDFSAGSRRVGSYCIDILGESSGSYASGDRNFNISYNNIHGVQRTMVLQAATSNGVISYNTISDATGCGIGGGGLSLNTTVHDNILNNVQDGIMVAGINRSIYNNTVNNVWLPTSYSGALKCYDCVDSNIYNNTVLNINQTATKGVYAYNLLNVTFENNTFIDMPTAIHLYNNNSDVFFKNTNITDSINTYVKINGTSSNVIFLNPKYNPAKIILEGVNLFRPYYYLDIKTKENNTVVDGAIITVSNDVSSYKSKNINYVDTDSYTTDENGRTPLPFIKATSGSVLDFLKNGTVSTEQNYTLTINKTGYSNLTLDNVNPSQNWHRANQDISKYTIYADFNQSENLHLIGYAPSVTENEFDTGDSVKFQIWTNNPLTQVVWKKDGVELQNSTSTTYEATISDAPITVDVIGTGETETISKSWTIDPDQTVDPTPDESASAPVANFTATPTNGTIRLKVQFNDTSENATAWYWDFDNNGKIDSTVRNASCYYNTQGNYTVKLTVSNSAGMDIETKTNYIQAEKQAWYMIFWNYLFGVAGGVISG